MTSADRLYLDHAATSRPKAPGVADAMARYARDLGASPGRGAYDEAREAGALLTLARRRLAFLLHADPAASRPEAVSDRAALRIVFTLNCSDALNLAIKGFASSCARAGNKPLLITTDLDHNSILRPIHALESRALARAVRIACDVRTGRVDPADIAAALRAHRGPALVAVHHASNVSGTVQPIADIADACRAHGALMLLDAAQTLGHLPIDVSALGIGLVAFPGHKGLLGPLGTGGLYLGPGVEDRIDTLREGGTGSRSELDRQPDDLPDKYEPGSHNAIGIAGLSESVRWILERGIDRLRAHEHAISAAFLDALAPDAQGRAGAARLLGPLDPAERVAVFSLAIDGMSPHEAAAVLESSFGLLARAGLHCAPGAHRTFGTLPDGAVRLSFGPFTTEDDARRAAAAVLELAAASV